RDAYQGKLKAAVSREEFAINHEIGRNLSTEEARELAYSTKAKELPPIADEPAERSNISPGLEPEQTVAAPPRSRAFPGVIYAALLIALILFAAIALVYWVRS
ncbi:MAG TPA: hypothetical protein VGJ02_11405, partial [Pyrinomonadaceae bacterium]